MSLQDRFHTHTVLNQPEALSGYNAWLGDLALMAAVEREGGMWAVSTLRDYGARVGGEMIELGRLADQNPPRLNSFDRYGNRIDEVEFHPAYHDIMSRAMAHGVHNFSWVNEGRPGAHVARAALLYLSTQADAGTCCPLTMTHAAIPPLRHAPDLAGQWIPRLTGNEYDPRPVPAAHKSTCTIGMGMTEKQGGSDVRSNTTTAHLLSGDEYELIGHKWFYSAPMCDAHLVLAQADGGLTCLLVPRLLPDGSHNAVHVQRLKDKLGDRSNASSEVEFKGAWARRVGDEGRGVATILEMVALTRLDCMLGSAGLMRQALVQALHHTAQRQAFGRLLVEQPLMENVLADLALEVEAAIALALRVARAVDSKDTDAHEAALARLVMPVGKYWICKRCAPMINEAQECLGGIGYVEDTLLPRLYRQAPLNSIWEGSGNIQCLDMLRALHREPQIQAALFDELRNVQGMDKGLDATIEWLQQEYRRPQAMEARARLVAEKTALAMQASILLQAGNDEVAGSFCRSRLHADRGLAFGTLPEGIPCRALIERAMPEETYRLRTGAASRETAQ